MEPIRAMGILGTRDLDKRIELVRAFAGPGGRMATVPDIVDARLANDPESFEWTGQFLTDTRLYVGYQGDRLVAVVTHGNGPVPKPKPYDTMFGPAWETMYSGDLYVNRLEFERLLRGDQGPFEVIDLDAYGAYRKGRGETTYVSELLACDVMGDPLVPAIFGPKAEEFVARLFDLNGKWMICHDSDRRRVTTGVVHVRLGEFERQLREQLRALPIARVLRANMGMLCRRKATDQHPRACLFGLSFVDNMETVDEGFGDVRTMVGVRAGDEPVSRIVMPIEWQRERLHGNWQRLLVDTPSEEAVSHLAMAERLYELIQADNRLFAIQRRSGWDGGPIPGPIVLRSEEFLAPTRLRVPAVEERKGRWKASIPEAIVANAPEGANAYLELRSEWDREDGPNRYVDVDVRYFHVCLDDRPFHHLMRVGGELFSMYERVTTDRPRASSEPKFRAVAAERIADAAFPPYSEEFVRNPWLWLGMVRSRAPEGANAVLVNENGDGAAYYRVGLDTSRAWRRWGEMKLDPVGTALQLEAAGLA